MKKDKRQQYVIDGSAKLPPPFGSLPKGLDDPTKSLKHRVFAILKYLPNAKPQAICTYLKEVFAEKGQTIRTYKWEYKNRQSEIQRGLNRYSFHDPNRYGYVPKFLARSKGCVVTKRAEACGWHLTKAKNRWLLWKDEKRGRLKWFETGRVNAWFKKPYSEAKMLQMIADAFFNTGLIPDTDFEVFQEFARSILKKGATLVIDMGVPLPYERIDMFKDSNGIIIIIGDKTHRSGVEIQFCKPDWAEKFEVDRDVFIQKQEQFTKQHQQFLDVMKQLTTPRPLKPSDRGMIS